MTAAQIVANLIQRGVQLRVNGQQLGVRAPKNAVTSHERDLIKQHKTEILSFLTEFCGDSVSFHRMSHGQKALWLLYQLAPESTAYNLMHAACICSNLDVPALRHAFQALIDRHACLRSTFTVMEEEPAQLVHDYMEVPFTVIDASTWSLDELKSRMEEEADSPFDLERGPVLRVNLFARSNKESFLLLVIHHIAFDFLSLDVMINELRILYDTKNRAEAVSTLTTQYPDYVRWQTEMIAGPQGEKLWDYWQHQLSGKLPPLDIPTDRPRPAVQRYFGATQNFIIGEDLTRQLKDFAKAEQATLYMTLLAVFQVLLHRYTAQEDILVGSPTAGRSRAEFLPIIGYFVNPVVLRVDVSGNPSFRAILKRVAGVVLGAIEHSDYPFPLLVQRLQPVRDSSRSPLFQVAFIFDAVNPNLRPRDVSASLESEDAVGPRNSSTLEMEMVGGGQRGAEFDLTVAIYEQGKSLSVLWRYNTDLFDVTTISRMSGHFQTLLEAIVSDPEQRLSDLPMLTAVEHRQLLVEWNDTERDYPKVKCLHELIEAQVERTPDAVALVFEDKQLTYRELNSRANQLAHYLRELGIGPDSLVGICVERSVEMVVGLLGILKTGGAYVPLDPAFPKGRLRFMLEDAQVKAVVTQREVRSDLPEHGARTICLDSDWSAIGRESTENFACDATPQNRAYVIYTSGSTGKPKGVEITHGSVVNFLTSMREKPGMTERDVMLAVTTISFDIAGLELYLPLVVGGRVVIASREIAVDGTRLSQHINNSQATVMQATPATWRILIDAGWEGSKQLKILCGGEALPRELANKLIEKSAALWNMYGPTETTIWSTVHQVSSTEGPVLVGRPIANTRIYILDHYMQPAPIGVPGELCIGGAGVARGYMNRPELTQEKFIADPFSEEPGARIYRTGDLARYLPDGNIELLGRIDHQVKVRGFRIELGEIEAVLREHPALRDAVVLAREDVPGDKRLVGYVVAAEPPPTTGELRSFLQRKLPDYMVPGMFVFLEALPLTPNGKVDRRALPAPDMTRPELESVFVAPEGGVEKTLAEIWRAVLGVERVGIHDNFFDLGGHSLLLTKVHSQLQAALGREVAMIDLFRYSTISTLAKYLSNGREADMSEDSADRAERQRVALEQQRLRMLSIAERRTALRND